MTLRIYDTDAYCKAFSATVLDCQPEKKNTWAVRLDQTAFYPEGGGQPGDQGVLGEAAVLDTRERHGDVVHIVDRPLPVGETVTGELNWRRRFDLMQNHSGEHIVSGVIHRKYGYNNVGFHMGHDTVTVDLDGEFPAQELAQFELEANQAVWADLPVDITVYDHEAAKGVEYRSKKDLPGDVRVVTFPGADSCACCGTHVAHSGEIGLIKLISVQKFKGGVRLEMLCGRRALEYINGIGEQNHAISVELSAKPMKTAAAVHKLKEEHGQAVYRLNQMEAEDFARRARILAGAGDVTLFEPPMGADSVRKLAVAVMERCGGRAAVFSGADGQGYKYAIGLEDGDLRALTKELNRTLNGRGGGKPFFVQGSVSASRKEIEIFLKKMDSAKE
ncbi:MAG: alanyl-tRNA editing protein [Clostridiales bacterium]|nr:alanyl-tRNA editing protein [Clostridiales bacterium]